MRFRCFVIAALSGLETLPPFPHPTFNPTQNTFISRKNSLSNDAKVKLHTFVILIFSFFVLVLCCGSELDGRSTINASNFALGCF